MNKTFISRFTPTTQSFAPTTTAYYSTTPGVLVDGVEDTPPSSSESDSGDKAGGKKK